jgi:acyl carrier protein
LLQGELYVTGRLKDVIIVRGRNHYPHDIERTAQRSHPAVDMGAAFAVAGARQEELVVVHQVKREHRKVDLDEVIRAMRSAIVEEHEVDPHHIALLRPVSLPITSSGKVQRSRCREQFLANELAISAAWTAPVGGAESLANGAREVARPKFLDALPEYDAAQLTAEIQAWLIDWLTQRANLTPGVMQPHTQFAELGIDSLSAVEISQELDQTLGLQLPPMVIWSSPTPAALAEYLREQLVASH